MGKTLRRDPASYSRKRTLRENTARQVRGANRHSEYDDFCVECLMPGICMCVQKSHSTEPTHWILEGDFGGQVYLTVPVDMVKCSEDELWKVLSKMDDIAWSCNEGEGAELYTDHCDGNEDDIPAGMGGGLMKTNELWVHGEFEPFIDEIRRALCEEQ